MLMWHLKDSAIESLLALPETGMGFQLVEAVIWGKSTPLLVLNSSNAIDLSQADLIPGDDPSDHSQKRRPYRGSDAAGCRADADGGARPSLIQASQHAHRQVADADIDFPSAPRGQAIQSREASHVAGEPRVSSFLRFQSRPPRQSDHGRFPAQHLRGARIGSGIRAHGLCCCGRFALPNNLPASYHYEIEAPAGTVVDFGTVAPAFGQAGGGFEAYFSTAVTNAKRPPTPVSKIPDE